MVVESEVNDSGGRENVRRHAYRCGEAAAQEELRLAKVSKKSLGFELSGFFYLGQSISIIFFSFGFILGPMNLGYHTLNSLLTL